MKYQITLFICLLACINVLAQEREIVSTAGDDIKVGEVAMSFTIGEPITELATSDAMYLTAGFQQSNIIVSIPLPTEDIRISAKIFPNPAVNTFYLDIDNQDIAGFFLVLHNTKGEYIRTEAITASPYKITLTSLPAGVYYMTILDGKNKKMHQFKVLKTE